MSSGTPFSVTSKTAIVTGAGSGINLAFATLLLAKGCNVVIADIALRPEAEKLVAEHSSAGKNARAVFVKTDVTSWSDLKNMFETALREFGDFHIVCPGAGIYEPHWSNFWHPPGSAASRDDKNGDRYALLDINITHPIRVTQLAISYWMHPGDDAPKVVEASPQNPKRIVHISSVAAQAPTFTAPLYGASKGAISGFVRSLEPLEAHSGIRVNAVAPGVVRTPLWTEHPEKLQFIALDEVGWVTPEEVAEAMLRCAEDDSVGCGTVLEVGKNNSRLVEVRNDPGPDPRPSLGLTAGAADTKGVEEVVQWLNDKDKWVR